MKHKEIRASKKIIEKLDATIKIYEAKNKNEKEEFKEDNRNE